MTVRSIPRVSTSRWATAFAEGAALLAVLCGVVIGAALLSRPL